VKPTTSQEGKWTGCYVRETLGIAGKLETQREEKKNQAKPNPPSRPIGQGSWPSLFPVKLVFLRFIGMHTKSHTNECTK